MNARMVLIGQFVIHQSTRRRHTILISDMTMTYHDIITNDRSVTASDLRLHYHRETKQHTVRYQSGIIILSRTYCTNTIIDNKQQSFIKSNTTHYSYLILHELLLWMILKYHSYFSYEVTISMLLFVVPCFVCSRFGDN